MKLFYAGLLGLAAWGARERSLRGSRNDAA